MNAVSEEQQADTGMCLSDLWQPIVRFFSWGSTSYDDPSESINLRDSFNLGGPPGHPNLESQQSLSSSMQSSSDSRRHDRNPNGIDASTASPIPQTSVVAIQPPMNKVMDPSDAQFPGLLNPFKDFISSQWPISMEDVPANRANANAQKIYHDFLALGPDHGLGKIQFTIGYDFQTRHLSVRIIQAHHLPAMDISGTSDPYVRVSILPDTQNKVLTKVKDRKLNPKWNELFIFEDFPQDNLLTRVLHLKVYDYDRFSRDDPIGEVSFELRHLCNTTQTEQFYTMWKNLCPCKKTRGFVGEILVSICYNPQSSRLTVTLIKAMKLKAMDVNKKSDPYCKIQLVETIQHRRRRPKDNNSITVLDTRKTTVKPKTLNPEWNEGFVFTLPPNRLSDVQVDIDVKDKDMFSSERIGRIRLGIHTSPDDAEHWKAMLSQPRRPVSMWHVLKH